MGLLSTRMQSSQQGVPEKVSSAYKAKVTSFAASLSTQLVNPTHNNFWNGWQPVKEIPPSFGLCKAIQFYV